MVCFSNNYLTSVLSSFGDRVAFSGDNTPFSAVKVLGVLVSCVLTGKIAAHASSFFRAPSIQSSQHRIVQDLDSPTYQSVKKRVYVDGVYDMLHVGHVRSFKYIKERFPEYDLVVGVINDKDATGYKREPIVKQEDRYEMVASTKFVDEVLEDAPLVVTPEFLEKHSIDIVVHGFSNPADREKQKAFFEPIKDKFVEIPYNFGSSTTDLISRVQQSHL